MKIKYEQNKLNSVLEDTLRIFINKYLYSHYSQIWHPWSVYPGMWHPRISRISISKVLIRYYSQMCHHMCLYTCHYSQRCHHMCLYTYVTIRKYAITSSNKVKINVQLWYTYVTIRKCAITSVYTHTSLLANVPSQKYL